MWLQPKVMLDVHLSEIFTEANLSSDFKQQGISTVYFDAGNWGS